MFNYVSTALGLLPSWSKLDFVVLLLLCLDSMNPLCQSRATIFFHIGDLRTYKTCKLDFIVYVQSLLLLLLLCIMYSKSLSKWLFNFWILFYLIPNIYTEFVLGIQKGSCWVSLGDYLFQFHFQVEMMLGWLEGIFTKTKVNPYIQTPLFQLWHRTRVLLTWDLEHLSVTKSILISRTSSRFGDLTQRSRSQLL